MKRVSLRVAYANVTLAALFGALQAEPALAHLDLRPRLIVQGELTDVRIELPQLRPGAPPSELEVEGEGIEVGSSELQETLGSDTIWTVRLRAESEPGVVPLVLRAVYDDGQTVEVDEELTVVPAPERVELPVAGGRCRRVAGGRVRGRLAPPRPPQTLIGH